MLGRRYAAASDNRYVWPCITVIPLNELNDLSPMIVAKPQPFPCIAPYTVFKHFPSSSQCLSDWLHATGNGNFIAFYCKCSKQRPSPVRSCHQHFGFPQCHQAIRQRARETRKTTAHQQLARAFEFLWLQISYQDEPHGGGQKLLT